MLCKRTPGRMISIAIAALLILTLMVSTCSFIVFNNIIASLFSPGNMEFLEKKAIYLRNYITIELLAITVIATCIILILKSTIAKLEAEKKKQEDLIVMQETEINRQRELVRNLAGLYNNAIEYDRMKTEFFSNMSHELKTPLSVILGAIQLIDKKNGASLSGQSGLDRNLKIIKQNSYRLVRLINNILDVTRLDSGYIKTNMSSCNIIYIVEEITQSIAPFAEHKGLHLEFDTDAEEVITSIDIDKMERIVLNLLSNAIKFTPAGGKVSVNMSEANEKVFIAVKDTGPGIPKEMQDLIFERFKQVNSGLTREHEGSGIGLSIAKSFVELQGGRLTLISEENMGSEFIIELPIKAVEAKLPENFEVHNQQDRIIEAINIEFSDIYNIAS